MPRTPSIRYFESRYAYYTQYHGRQHLLATGPKDEPDGPTYKAAVERFSHIMHADEAAGTSDECRVSAVIARYYFALEREGRASSLHQARTLLDPAIAEFGYVRVRDLKPFIVRDWVEKQKTWNSSTKHTAIGRLSRALYWAKKEGQISANPLAGMEKPEKLVRGKEVLVPEPLLELLIRLANPEFAKLLTFLRDTGCRPGEAMHADCKHYRKEVGALVYPWNAAPGEYRWKNAKKTKRDRVIYLTPALQELVEGEIARHGGRGHIFRTVRGKPWTNNNLVNRLDKLLGHKDVIKWCRQHDFSTDRVMCYSLRHGYISRMLTAGCPIKILADLCGTSVAMIEKTYSHAHDDLTAMRRLFLQFSGAASSPPGP